MEFLHPRWVLFSDFWHPTRPQVWYKFWVSTPGLYSWSLIHSRNILRSMPSDHGAVSLFDRKSCKWKRWYALDLGTRVMVISTRDQYKALWSSAKQFVIFWRTCKIFWKTYKEKERKIEDIKIYKDLLDQVQIFKNSIFELLCTEKGILNIMGGQNQAKVMKGH